MELPTKEHNVIETLPLGFYPFTFGYLQQLPPEKRVKQLDILQRLWETFFENISKQQKIPIHEYSPNKRQVLHTYFLNSLVAVCNEEVTFLPEALSQIQILPCNYEYVRFIYVFILNY